MREREAEKNNAIVFVSHMARSCDPMVVGGGCRASGPLSLVSSIPHTNTRPCGTKNTDFLEMDDEGALSDGAPGSPVPVSTPVCSPCVCLTDCWLGPVCLLHYSLSSHQSQCEPNLLLHRHRREMHGKRLKKCSSVNVLTLRHCDINRVETDGYTG